MSQQSFIPPDLEDQIKKINHDLDHFDELLSQIEDEKILCSLEGKNKLTISK